MTVAENLSMAVNAVIMSLKFFLNSGCLLFTGLAQYPSALFIIPRSYGLVALARDYLHVGYGYYSGHLQQHVRTCSSVVEYSV